ncbi:D-alanyl-D-alanine carboxypeptidase [Paenibacillus shirakamiensis]|uniref:D-alanyl-D-alanine carboxypeptidase n=1 Tax=Paenibacillus shirakamiensis TaxID=1265935 RepID=A0ABS4JM92_9BACL|nr:M15 family metallopeptidase [Paenibacillus shirakamiensis]MBP2002231.1 D-alanyl-D-alanine carboxypeptidase [Paenibacillus shirakamiensis]
MKKWVFWLVILLLLIAYGMTWLIPDDKQKIVNIIDSDAEISSGDLHIQPTQVHKGNLVLVNKRYPLDEVGIQPDIVTLAKRKELIQGYALMNENLRLSEHVAQLFKSMVLDAADDHVNHFLISSGFRTFKEQSRIFADKGDAYALPAGHSEHNLGLSLDIGSSQGKMSQAAEGQWLKEHAWNYGFILRYPQDKTEVTGIAYEPWHFRYVGLPHSVLMRKKNFSLEEYIEDIRHQKTMNAEVAGRTYTISYYPVSKTRTIKIPLHQRYEISGDNQGGVIVTTYAK